MISMHHIKLDNVTIKKKVRQNCCVFFLFVVKESKKAVVKNNKVYGNAVSRR